MNDDETKKRAHCLDLQGVWFETDNLEKVYKLVYLIRFSEKC